MTLKERFVKYNTIATGVIAGIILPVLLYLVLYFIKVRDISLTLFSSSQLVANIIPVVISHCILPNLLLFFIFLGLNWSHAAKGLLGVTAALTLLLFALKLVLNSI